MARGGDDETKGEFGSISRNLSILRGPRNRVTDYRASLLPLPSSKKNNNIDNKKLSCSLTVQGETCLTYKKYIQLRCVYKHSKYPKRNKLWKEENGIRVQKEFLTTNQTIERKGIKEIGSKWAPEKVANREKGRGKSIWYLRNTCTTTCAP